MMASLRDKIGQMLIIGFNGYEVNKDVDLIKIINANNIGGVILFDYDYENKIFGKNIKNPAQVHHLNTKLQHFNFLANLIHYRPLLPLFIAVDYEGGKVNRLKKEYGFDDVMSASALAQMDTVTIEQKCLKMAATLQQARFNLNFAPVIDLKINNTNTIIGKLNRSFSASAAEVARIAKIFVRSFLASGICCVYKHFPGLGSAQSDPHLEFVDVSNIWNREELKPYEYLLSGGDNRSVMIMTAHIVNRQLDATGLPATFSPQIIKILREQLKFNGVIVTDDLQMQAITTNYTLAETLKLAINAGVDQLLFGNQLAKINAEQIVDIIEQHVITGQVQEQRVNEAYQRIVALKTHMYIKNTSSHSE